MSIQVNTGANAVNWEALLGKLGEVTKTQGADGVAGTTSVTITTTVDGVATPVTINIPDDLELPGEVDQAAIDTLCAKLSADTGLNLSDKQIEQFHDALTGSLKELANVAAGDTKASAAKNAMFDLYKLMALLVEVAQKQRDANREMRQAESQAIQTSILNQAQAQRDAAITGMIAGACCCLLQVAATSFALVQQGKAFKAQLGTDKTAGLDVARQNMDMVKAANTSQNAQAQLNSVQAEVGGKFSLDGHNRTIQSKVETSFNNPELTADATRFTNATTTFHEKVGLNQTLQAISADPAHLGDLTSANLEVLQGPEVAGIKTAVGKLDAFKAEMAKLDQIQGLSPEDKAFFIDQMTSDNPNLSIEATDRMATLRQQFPGLNDVNLNEGDTLPKFTAEVKTAFDDAIADLQPKLAEGGPLRNEVAAAKQELRAQIKIEMMKFEDAYDAELQNFNDVSKNGTKAEIAEAEARLDTAANELKYARALGNAKLMEGDLTDSQAHLSDVESARSKYSEVQSVRASSVDYIKASNTINNAQAVNGLIGAIGSFAQGIVQNATQLQQAEATLEGAEQTRKQEELDQTKDLFNQAQELVNSVVQLMQAIGAAETQSMRDAIQA